MKYFALFGSGDLDLKKESSFSFFLDSVKREDFCDFCDGRAAKDIQNRVIYRKI